MIRFYVYALTGAPVPDLAAVKRDLVSIDLGGIFAVAEPMTQVPPVSEDALRRQHDVVVAIAGRADAALPARFGSLVDEPELRRIVDARRDAIDGALDLVRGREQMTARIMGARAPDAAAQDPLPASGTAYLHARRAAASGAGLPGVDAVQRAVHDLAAADRVQPGPSMVTLYHLIPSGASDSYRARVAAAARDIVPLVVRVSGPWPPFAFVPELVA